MIKQASTQISSPKEYLGKNEGNQEAKIATADAARNWSSFLTWRRPKNFASVTNTDATTPPKEITHHDYHSPSERRQPSSSRSRAPIPFNVGPRRTSSSGSSTSSIPDLLHEDVGSTSVMEVERGLAAAYDDDDEDDQINALGSAFASLSRVRRKAECDWGPIDRLESPSSPRRTSSAFNTASFSHEPAINESWLAWGSSTIKSTLTRGMVSSLFPPESIVKGDHSSYPTSPTVSNRRSSILSSEKERIAERDQIDCYVDDMIGFAGVDGQSRSIVTLSAPSLPPIDVVSHDAMLDRTLVRTRPVVESAVNGYTLILFASGADLIDGEQGSKTAWPGWTWCWKAWRSLDRSYRKNLKKMYIVHPTFFTRTLVRLISTGSYFVSPKFAKKIVQCNSLEELNRQVPLNQLEIPPEVLIWDLKMGAKEGIEESEKDMATIPMMVRDCVDVLKVGSLLDTEGIFRVSPSQALLRSARYAYQLNQRPNLMRFVKKDTHLPAALLKSHLRCLSSPIFPASTYFAIQSCPTIPDEDTLHYIRHTLLPMLDVSKSILLSYTLQCLHEVSIRSDKNRMDSSNLATVMTPNLVCSDNPIKDVMMCRVQKQGQINDDSNKTENTMEPTTLGTVIAFCIEKYYEVFDEIDIETPVLNFEVDKEQKRNSLGTLTSSTKKSLAQRNLPSSPTSRAHGVSVAMPQSPSRIALTTKRSSSSLRVKNRLLSGGSLKSGVSLVDKGSQSIALVGTSATGEFNRRPSKNYDQEDDEGREGEDTLLDLQALPLINTRHRANSRADSSHRRPLSEVFEE